MMEIYNEKMERIEAPDLELGWLEETVRLVHHAGVEAIEERWHYETTAEYPNGGRDLRRVIDAPGIQAKPAWEEEIPIQIYHAYTAAELEEKRQEAAKPTLEARMGRMEEAMQRLSGMIEEAVKKWQPAAGGEE